MHTYSCSEVLHVLPDIRYFILPTVTPPIPISSKGSGRNEGMERLILFLEGYLPELAPSSLLVHVAKLQCAGMLCILST